MCLLLESKITKQIKSYAEISGEIFNEIEFDVRIEAVFNNDVQLWIPIEYSYPHTTVIPRYDKIHIIPYIISKFWSKIIVKFEENKF